MITGVMITYLTDLMITRLMTTGCCMTRVLWPVQVRFPLGRHPVAGIAWWLLGGACDPCDPL